MTGIQALERALQAFLANATWQKLNVESLNIRGYGTQTLIANFDVVTGQSRLRPLTITALKQIFSAHCQRLIVLWTSTPASGTMGSFEYSSTWIIALWAVELGRDSMSNLGVKGSLVHPSPWRSLHAVSLPSKTTSVVFYFTCKHCFKSKLKSV